MDVLQKGERRIASRKQTTLSETFLTRKRRRRNSNARCIFCRCLYHKRVVFYCVFIYVVLLVVVSRKLCTVCISFLHSLNLGLRAREYLRRTTTAWFFSAIQKCNTLVRICDFNTKTFATFLPRLSFFFTKDGKRRRRRCREEKTARRCWHC